MRTTCYWVICGTICCCWGCGTTTQRFATEQLLISDAVDQAINQIDFSYLADKDIFLETRYLRAIKGTGFANTDYIISALREQLAAAGCRIHDAAEQAEIIVEPRVGALGTDGHEVTYGIPQTGQLTSAAAAFSNAPIVPAIPEISFGKSDKQLGIAKIVLFAYDRESKVAVWQSGLQKSESTCTNTWVMGAGPFQKGTIYDGYRFAGQDIRKNSLRPGNDFFQEESIEQNPDVQSVQYLAEASDDLPPNPEDDEESKPEKDADSDNKANANSDGSENQADSQTSVDS